MRRGNIKYGAYASMKKIFHYFKKKNTKKAGQEKINDKLIKKVIGNVKCPIIFDIGANDGEDSLWLANLFPYSTVYSFECDPRAIKRFKKKVGDHKRIFLQEYAVSKSNGKITFHQSDGQMAGKEIDEGWDYSGSIHKPKNHLVKYPWVKFENTIEVNTVRIDDWCLANNINHIDFIWMDVQGAELDVIEGGRDFVFKNANVLYTEYSEWEMYENQPNLKTLMQSLSNYRIEKRFRYDVLLMKKVNFLSKFFK